MNTESHPKPSGYSILLWALIAIGIAAGIAAVGNLAHLRLVWAAIGIIAVIIVLVIVVGFWPDPEEP